MPTDKASSATFRDDESGAVAVIVALLLTVLLGFAAFAIDFGLLTRDKARLQGYADLAAISAVADLPAAAPRAQSVIARNASEPPAITAIRYGRFIPDPTVPAAARFTEMDAADHGVNAVKLDLQHPTPLVFAGSFLPQTEVMLTTTATAMQARGASFSLSSGLLRLDSGAVNALLARAFGTSVSLSVLDHAALLSGQVNLLDFLDALATDADVTAGNYRDILDLEMALPRVLDAIAASQTGIVAQVLADLSGRAPNRNLPLQGIISLPEPELGLVLADFIDATEVTALDLLVAALDVVSADRALDLDLALAIHGVLGVDTLLLVQERPAQSGWISVGEPQASLHTAQTRLRSDLDIAPNLLSGLGIDVSVVEVHLPLYLEIANARATLTDLNCRPAQATDAVATFQTSTGLQGTAAGPHIAELFLGSFTPDQFTAPGGLRAADLQFADLVDIAIEIDLFLLPPIRIGLLTLQARSHTIIGSGQTDQISFSQSDIASGQISKRVSSGNVLSTGIGSLLHADNLQIRVEPSQLPLLAGLVGPVVNTVIAALPTALLAGVAEPVDQALDEVLRLAGIELGTAEITLNAAHCARPRLMR